MNGMIVASFLNHKAPKVWNKRRKIILGITLPTMRMKLSTVSIPI